MTLLSTDNTEVCGCFILLPIIFVSLVKSIWASLPDSTHLLDIILLNFASSRKQHLQVNLQVLKLWKDHRTREASSALPHFRDLDFVTISKKNLRDSQEAKRCHSFGSEDKLGLYLDIAVPIWWLRTAVKGAAPTMQVFQRSESQIPRLNFMALIPPAMVGQD